MFQNLSKYLALACAAFVLTASFAQAAIQYPDAVVASSPIAYYRLNETSGSTADDEVGSNDATYGSGVTLGVAGPRPSDGFVGFESTNNAVDLNENNNNSRITIPTALGMSSSIGSVVLWFNGNSGDIDSNGTSFLWYGAASGGDGFGSQNEMHVHLNTTGNIGMFIRGSGGNTQLSTSSSGLSLLDDEWHQLVFTWDRNDAGDDAARVYIDGLEVLSVKDDSNNFSLSNSILAGRPNSTNTLGNSRIWGGKLDEIALYNDRLTAQEVSDLYLAAVPEPSTYAVFGGLMLCFGVAGWWRKRKSAA